MAGKKYSRKGREIQRRHSNKHRCKTLLSLPENFWSFSQLTNRRERSDRYLLKQQCRQQNMVVGAKSGTKRGGPETVQNKTNTKRFN